MNWEAIGAIGEAFSAMALFFVLVQLRHARAEVRRSVSQVRGEAARELMLNRVNNQWLNSLIVKANGGLGSTSRSPFAETLMERCGLTLEEGIALGWEQRAWWHYRTQVIANVDQLTAAERASFDLSVRAFHQLALTRIWYDMTKSTLDADMVRYIDNLLAQPG